MNLVLTSVWRLCRLYIMVRTQIQFPDPLYHRLKEIAAERDWSLAEVIRLSAEHFVSRFPKSAVTPSTWQFPMLDCGGDFLTDPAETSAEAEATLARSR